MEADVRLSTCVNAAAIKAVGIRSGLLRLVMSAGARRVEILNVEEVHYDGLETTAPTPGSCQGAARMRCCPVFGP